MHIEDPLGEIKQLGGDESRDGISANARAAQAKADVANEKLAAAQEARNERAALLAEKDAPPDERAAILKEKEVYAQGAPAVAAKAPVQEKEKAV